MERSGEFLYRDRAELYDRIYHWKDYDTEARLVHELLAAEGVADGSRLLDVATGTGRHLVPLRAWYEVAGLDLHPEMLAVARRRLPGLALIEGDMAAFEVERPFDAVTCLFSSIGYLENVARLAAAARCLAAAVRPGGVVVVQPWLTPEEAIDGVCLLDTYESEELKLCRMSDGRVEGGRSVLEFHWLVGRPGGGVEAFVERHELTLFSHQQMLDALAAAGLQPRLDPRDLGGRPGLYVARRPG